MRIRITQIDGSLPNLALMRLAAWHRAQGDEVHVTRSVVPDLFESVYDAVYGSAIFKSSAKLVERFRKCWPGAILGGTGTDSLLEVEDITGAGWDKVDYAGFWGIDRHRRPYVPRFSIGFTMRGCRQKCGFCCVPGKEGPARSVASIPDIWRGAGHPRQLHLLDNDFFGGDWRERVAEIRVGNFRVCLSQGVNVRRIGEEEAAALASIEYRDTTFRRRRLYTAWDNLGDEKRFFTGVDLLQAAGIPPEHLCTFMLIGYDQKETWERIWHRFLRMVDRGIRPYPMLFDDSRDNLKAFQRWCNTGLYRRVPWDEYERSTRTEESTEAYLSMRVRTELKCSETPVLRGGIGIASSALLQGVL